MPDAIWILIAGLAAGTVGGGALGYLLGRGHRMRGPINLGRQR